MACSCLVALQPLAGIFLMFPAVGVFSMTDFVALATLACESVAALSSSSLLVVGPVILSFLAGVSKVAFLATVVAFSIEGESSHGRLILVRAGVAVIAIVQLVVAEVVPLQDLFFKMINSDILLLEIDNLLDAGHELLGGGTDHVGYQLVF